VLVVWAALVMRSFVEKQQQQDPVFSKLRLEHALLSTTNAMHL